MDIKTGDPLILVDASGMEEEGLTEGMKGWCNSITHVDKQYIFFMPSETKSMFVMTADRFVVDEEAKAAGLELNQDTIAKGSL